MGGLHENLLDTDLYLFLIEVSNIYQLLCSHRKILFLAEVIAGRCLCVVVLRDRFSIAPHQY